MVDELTAWCGFLGAWLVVVGSIHQANLELQAEEEAAERMRVLQSTVPPPPPISRWWWLLPPVRFELGRRRRTRVRQSFVDSMSDEDHELLTRYLQKATGWMFVGLGGALIAAKETEGLVLERHWPTVVFWALVAVMVALAFANAARTNRHDRDGRRLRPR